MDKERYQADCLYCQEVIRPKQHIIDCSTCSRPTHRTCSTGISIQDYRQSRHHGIAIPFTCKKCLNNVAMTQVTERPQLKLKLRRIPDLKDHYMIISSHDFSVELPTTPPPVDSPHTSSPSRHNTVDQTCFEEEFSAFLAFIDSLNQHNEDRGVCKENGANQWQQNRWPENTISQQSTP